MIVRSAHIERSPLLHAATKHMLEYLNQRLNILVTVEDLITEKRDVVARLEAMLENTRMLVMGSR
jgi:hypothetical protein